MNTTEYPPFECPACKDLIDPKDVKCGNCKSYYSLAGLLREHRRKCFEYLFTRLTQDDQDVREQIGNQESDNQAEGLMRMLMDRIDKRMQGVCILPSESTTYYYGKERPRRMVIYTREVKSGVFDNFEVVFKHLEFSKRRVIGVDMAREEKP